SRLEAGSTSESGLSAASTLKNEVETKGGAASPQVATGESSSPPDAIEPSEDILEAWKRWLGSGRGLPTGLVGFLRSAEVSQGPDGDIVVRPIPGPAYERLSTTPVLETIREGLTPFAGRRPVIRVEAPAKELDRSVRISEADAKADTLRALVRQEPRLERAVEELDLELMD
ncbi:MAG: hypothetical protein ACKVIN_15545, partial [Longimicrobiales bacterium]